LQAPKTVKTTVKTKTVKRCKKQEQQCTHKNQGPQDLDVDRENNATAIVNKSNHQGKRRLGIFLMFQSFEIITKKSYQRSFSPTLSATRGQLLGNYSAHLKAFFPKTLRDARFVLLESIWPVALISTIARPAIQDPLETASIHEDWDQYSPVARIMPTVVKYGNETKARETYRKLFESSVHKESSTTSLSI